MKKIFSTILALTAILALATSCADVPMPYDIFANGDASFGKRLPYKTASLSSFSMYDLKDGSAWSQGSSYTQATGYQTWDGSTKTNKEVESYLISPALNTTCASGKVRISFDQTIRYENKVTNWQNYHKIYISKDYSGNSADFGKATWTELAYTPKASTTNDWTLYESGYIAIPETFVNHDSVYVAFYFYAPAANSTTWELENFIIDEGEATGDGTKESPYNVAAILKYTQSLVADQNSDKDYYFEGIVCDDPNIDTDSYGNATFRISDDGTSNNSFYIFRTFSFDGAKFTDAGVLKKGDKVVICSPVVNYKGNTAETVGNKGKIISINGKTEGTDTPDSGSKDEEPGAGSSEGVKPEGNILTLTNIASSATAGNSVTIDLSTLGYENATDVTTVTLSDGSTITFGAGTNKNTPKYYTATNGVRVYGNNTITFEGKATILKITIECDSYNGTDYTGQKTATAEFSGNKVVYTNAGSETTQLRAKKITITYAAGN